MAIIFSNTELNDLLSSLYSSYGHLAHLPHYNGGESRYSSGRYYAFIALDPEYGIAKDPIKIEFSVQDLDSKDVYDVTTMVIHLQEKDFMFFPGRLETLAILFFITHFLKMGITKLYLALQQKRQLIAMHHMYCKMDTMGE